MGVLQDSGLQQQHGVRQVSLSRLLQSLFKRVGQILVGIICVEVVTLPVEKKRGKNNETEAEADAASASVLKCKSASRAEAPAPGIDLSRMLRAGAELLGVRRFSSNVKVCIFKVGLPRCFVGRSIMTLKSL